MSGGTSERLRSLYLWRVTNYVVLGLECALIAAEVFLFHNLLGVVGATLAIGIMLLAIGRNARSIARARRSLRRPDYALIGAMEREVYGETFRHDGAPEPEPVRKASCAYCPAGHPVIGGSCRTCYEQHRRLLGPKPHGMTTAEYAGGIGRTVVATFGIPPNTTHYAGSMETYSAGGGGGTGTSIVVCGTCGHPLSQCGCIPPRQGEQR